MNAVRCTVSGRVQGVSYRAWTQRQARSLELTGWVRNLTDGRVELLAQGDQLRIDALLMRLKDGPALARVDGLQAHSVAPETAQTTFEIRPTADPASSSI